jgi:hypothetical protein
LLTPKKKALAATYQNSKACFSEKKKGCGHTPALFFSHKKGACGNVPALRVFFHKTGACGNVSGPKYYL